MPRGQIIEQDPSPAILSRRAARSISSTSLGPAIVDLSGLNAKGKAFEDVSKQLTDLGLKPNRLEEQSADVDAGLVTRIDPNDKIIQGGTVAVYVSTGKPTPTPSPATPTPSATVRGTTQPTATTPASGTAALPDVTGKTLNEATQALEQKGFTNIQRAIAASTLRGFPSGVPHPKKGSVVAVVVSTQGTAFQAVSPGQQVATDTPLYLVVQD